MKKCLLVILSSVMCLFAYSANVPKVNNHGFPQNLKPTSKEVVIEQQEIECQTPCAETAVPVKSKKINRKPSLNNVAENSVTAASNESVTNNQTDKAQIKKDIKTQRKEIKKILKGSKSNEFTVASVLGSIGFCLILLSYFVLWPLMFVGIIFSIIALVMGIANSDKIAIIYGAVGMLLFVIGLVLLSLLLAI